MNNYGEALQYQREISGLSLIELERRVGISNQNLGRWERGEVLPNIDFCVRLAKFYGISIDELVGISVSNTPTTAQNAAPAHSAEERQKLTIKEKAMLEAFRNLLPETQDFILRSAQSLKDKHNKIET